MTVKELKECFSQFNLKTKINVPNNREITNNDIEEGKIFQKFVSRENIQNVISGLGLLNNVYHYFYVVLDSIEIETDDSFPPCGGEQEVSVFAYYSIRAHGINGTDEEYKVGRSKVNALIKLDNPLFTYEKHNIINNEPNNGDINIEVNVNASYYYNGIKHTASKLVIQHVNKKSSWLIESEPTQLISLTLSQNNISNKGGIVLAKVERLFTRIYYMKDSCGNKVAEKSEPNLIEDITSKSIISTSNKKAFAINKNIISVSKQPTGAPKRETTVTARFLDKVATCTFVQNEGGKVNYEYKLSFENDSKTKFFDLESSRITKKKVYITSKRIEYIDDEYAGETNTDNLNISSDCNWVNGIAAKDGNGVFILVQTTENNDDKNNDREAALTITNPNDESLSIMLIVSQQALSIINKKYDVHFYKTGEYTTEELNNATVYFHPYKALIYEDESIDEINIEDSIEIKYDYASSDNNKLNISSLTKRNNDYIVNINNFTLSSIKDISLKMRIFFYDGNKKIFNSEIEEIIVKGNKIIDYNYELCFNGHDKFKTVLWENDKTPRTIYVNSIKHELVNGKQTGYYNVPFKISIYDENGKEKFDDSFSLKKIDNEIIAFPINVKSDVTNNYVITQYESGLKTNLSLSYITKKELIKTNLKVIVYCDNIGYDVWTGENGYLSIDGKDTIKLNPCWLSPTMKDGVDIAYNGVITLEKGLHSFKTFNVIRLDNTSKTRENCNIYKEIFVDENTKDITLQIKV